jgi:polyisoprenoid-binding protein YceI
MTRNSATAGTSSLSAWTIDAAHSHIEFAVKHMMIATVKGRFGSVSGRIRLDEEQPDRSEVEVTIEAASIDTRNAQRDTHLRSADFLDVENHPAITFRSTGVKRVSQDRLRVRGDLTIRGTTRPVDLDVTVLGRNRSPWGQDVIAWSAETSIDREDFGLTWNQALEAGGVLVANTVRIHLEVEAILEAEGDDEA